MSYVKREGLGVDWSGASNTASKAVDTAMAYIDKALPALDSVRYILEDPALPQITGQIIKLHNAEKAHAGPAKAQSFKGINLQRIVPPLKLYVKTREQPILGYAIIAGALAVPFLIGYLFGKR